MHYGLSLPNGGPCADPRTQAEFAALAEAAGFEGIFLEDYLVYQNQPGVPTYDPWVSLAAMAMRTERVRLGTTVTPVARRRVGKLAAETVALDHLSGGRVVLGVGLGDQWDASLAGFGDAHDTHTRARMVDETLEALVGLWSGEPFSYRGEFVTVENVTLQPKPVQQPRIPIWIGGRYPGKAAVRRAARWDGSCLFKAAEYSANEAIPADWSPDDVRTLKAQLQPGADIVLSGAEHPPEAATLRALEDAGLTWWVEWLAPSDYATMRAAIERGPQANR